MEKIKASKLIVLFWLLNTVDAFECSKGETYSECGSYCESSCDGDDDIMCPAVCVQGCFCEEGKVRAGVNNSACVDIGECPKYVGCEKNKVRRNEVCPKSCLFLKSNVEEHCFGLLAPDQEEEEENLPCHCPEESPFWDEEAGCLSEENCLAYEYKEKECHGGSFWNLCGSVCPKTCATWNVTYKCVSVCQPRCDCPSFTVWDETSEKCVPVHECEEFEFPEFEGISCTKDLKNCQDGRGKNITSVFRNPAKDCNFSQCPDLNTHNCKTCGPNGFTLDFGCTICSCTSSDGTSLDDPICLQNPECDLDEYQAVRYAWSACVGDDAENNAGIALPSFSVWFTIALLVLVNLF